MIPPWPPSPSVEDEVSALANEHVPDTPIETVIEQVKSADQPAGNRGTINQCPIILDENDHGEKIRQPKPTTSKPSTSTEPQSSDDSSGPATPPPLTRDSRTQTTPTQGTSGRTPRSKSIPPPTSQETTPRVRPNIARIQTDVGNDLDSMITGRRRAPSPYAYRPSQPHGKPETARRYSGEQLLSPTSATLNPRNLSGSETKRSASARPRDSQRSDSSSAESEARLERRRHHSRRRSTRDSFSRPERTSADRISPAFDKRDPVAPHSIPDKGLLSSGLQGHSNSPTVSNAGSRRVSKESPYTSSAEESRPSHRSYRHRSSIESPYTSSGEDAKSRHRDSNGHHSRRKSVSAKHRPRPEDLSQHVSYGGAETAADKHDFSKHRHDSRHHPVFDGRTHLEPSTPGSARAPLASEDVWRKAFEDNKTKRPNHMSRSSAQASPFTSPPRTPPRTPGYERRSKDYFDLMSPVSSQVPMAPQWSRSPSVEQGSLKELRSSALQGVAAAGVVPIVASVPGLSRSSTYSEEATSSGSTSKPSSGQRSRRPSPIHEDVRPVSRSGSYTARDDRPPPRPVGFPVSEERPISRGGLTASNAGPHPHLGTRALSYSSAMDPNPQRPSSSHRVPAVLPPSATMSEPPYVAGQSKLTRSQSTASRPQSILRPSPPIPETPVAVLPSKCPRSVPKAGLSDWHTIQGIPEIDICPTCVAALGASRFRDHFTPGPPKPPKQEVKCSMSSPWLRVAWLQIQKSNLPNLELMRKIVQLPSGARACPEKKFEARPWFRMIDPVTGKPIQGFEVCSACVYRIDTLFPSLVGVLGRTDALVQERGCNLHSESTRFAGYINEFDRANTKCKGEPFRKMDSHIQDLADHARRTSRIRECLRDAPTFTSPWHYMPEFPEFTICEECFEHVVRPIKNEPIAKNIGRTLKLVPIAWSGRFANGMTCQLYSERMRKLFREAVKYNDLDTLRIPAKKRIEAEKLLQEKHRLLLADVKAGCDRTEEIERISRVWKTWE